MREEYEGCQPRQRESPKGTSSILFRKHVGQLDFEPVQYRLKFANRQPMLSAFDSMQGRMRQANPLSEFGIRKFPTPFPQEYRQLLVQALLSHKQENCKSRVTYA